MNNLEELINMRILFIFFGILMCMSTAYPDNQVRVERAPLVEDELSRLQWSSSIHPTVAESRFKKQSVASFVEKLTGLAEFSPNVLDVEEFKWVDLDDDGTYELIASVGFTGGYFNELFVIKKQSKEYTFQRLSNFARFGEDTIQDLNGDGKQELILKEQYTRGSGQNIVLWTVVYAWSGKGFADASSSFPEFYKMKVLPEVEQRIQQKKTFIQEELAGRLSGKTEVEAAEAREINDEVLAGDILVRDRILRAIGTDPAAGIDTLKTWAKDGNPVLRMFAARGFADAPALVAQEYLNMLSNDENSEVASYARTNVERLKRSTPK